MTANGKSALRPPSLATSSAGSISACRYSTDRSGLFGLSAGFISHGKSKAYGNWSLTWWVTSVGRKSYHSD